MAFPRVLSAIIQPHLPVSVMRNWRIRQSSMRFRLFSEVWFKRRRGFPPTWMSNWRWRQTSPACTVRRLSAGPSNTTSATIQTGSKDSERTGLNTPTRLKTAENRHFDRIPARTTRPRISDFPQIGENGRFQGAKYQTAVYRKYRKPPGSV